MFYHTPKPFYRKSRNRWYIQLDGRQINLGFDREEAFRRYHKLMAENASDGPSQIHVPGDCSVATICDHFLDWVQRNRSADTYEWYRYRLQRFIDQFPGLAADDLRPYHIEKWVASYELSTTSRRNYFRSIKRCMKWAKRQGFVSANPIELLEVPSAERRETYIPPDEFERLLGFVTNEDFRDLLIATYATGCRPQESLRVQTRHVEIHNRRWVFQPSEAKGKRIPRIVYLSDDAFLITSRRLRSQSPNAYLFCNTKGRPWTTDAVNCGFDQLQLRMGKAALAGQELDVGDDDVEALIPTLRQQKTEKGVVRDKRLSELRAEARLKLRTKLYRKHVPRYSLYALRHSWATNSLQRGLDSLTVAILMGHKDPSTLARVYQHLGQNPEHMQEQARKAANDTRKRRD